LQELDKKYTHIPKALKDLKIWCCYNDIISDADKDKSEDEIKKIIKSPRDLKGNYLKWKSKNTFYSYKECLESIRKGFNNGIGIIVKPKTGIMVIDYDNCIKGYKKIDKLGLNIPLLKEDVKDRITRDLNLLNSYCEISPSGYGLHIYLVANYDININKQEGLGIEIYNNHFIRVSGNIYNNYDSLEDKTAELEQLIKLYGLDALKNVDIKDNIIKGKHNIYKKELESKFYYKNNKDDADIINIMFNSKKGKFLKDLFYDTISDADYINIKKLSKYYQKNIKDYEITKIKSIDASNSGKSFTLILNLLHYCYGDIKAVKRIFKKSKLCRDDYLIKNRDNGKADIIDSQFIPQAIKYYYNYSDELF